MAQMPADESATHSDKVTPYTGDARSDEKKYRGETSGYVVDSSTDPSAMGSLPQNNPVAKSMLEKGYRPEAIERLLADMENAAKQELLPEEIKSDVPLDAEEKEQLYSMIIIQQRGMTLEQLRKKRAARMNGPVVNTINDAVEAITEKVEDTKTIVEEILSEVQTFFHSIPAWSLRAIRALRRDVQKLIEMEGVALMNLGVTHNPREKVNIIDVQERGPSRTPAIARANAKAQGQGQAQVRSRSKQ